MIDGYPGFLTPSQLKRAFQGEEDQTTAAGLLSAMSRPIYWWIMEWLLSSY